MNRRMFIALLASQSLAVTGEVRAQSSTRAYRIAFLYNGTPTSVRHFFEATKAGLRDFGYVETRNIVIDVRYAEGQYERIPLLVAELVRAQPDVIIGSGTPALLAFKKATTSIPIVMAASSDPELTGLVASLARPGGNVTGSAILGSEMMIKRLELLGELLPRAAKVAIFWNPDNPSSVVQRDATRAALASMRFRSERIDVRSSSDIEAAFLTASTQKIDAALIDDDGVLRTNFRSIAELALKYRIPTCGPSDFAEAGGLLSFGPDYLVLFRRAGYFVDKILKGAKPAEVPVEQSATFTLVVNRRTAKALDIKMPLSIMLRADKVID